MAIIKFTKSNLSKVYKARLRKEFFHRCVYCGTREPELGGSQSFHIDHYKPKSKFPKLETRYFNLLYACRNCNAYKGPYWPNKLEKLLGQVILNPRTDKIESHIDQSAFVWNSKTSRGKWNIEKLRLVSPALIQRRQDRNSIEQTVAQLGKILDRAKQGLAIAIEQNAPAFEIQNLEQDIADQIMQIHALQRKIIGPMD